MDSEWTISEEAKRVMLLPTEQRTISLRSASPQVRAEIAVACALTLNQRFPAMSAVTDALLDAAMHRDGESNTETRRTTDGV